MAWSKAVVELLTHMAKLGQLEPEGIIPPPPYSLINMCA